MKIGLLGLGSIGIRHALNLLSMGHEVYWYDPWQTKGKLPPGATRVAEEELAMEGKDALVIASPTNCHYLQLIKASVYSIPIFVEKPIAHSTLALEALKQWGPKQLVMVGNNLRFHAGVLRAKEWLEKGMAGQPHWASFMLAQFTAKDAYKRDGVILNWGAHELDLALHLLGPASVAASVARAGAPLAPEDLADIILSHDSGVLSSVHLDYLGQPECRAAMIMCEKGWIIVDLVHRVNVLRRPSGQEMIEELKGSFAQDYLDEMQNFIDAIEGKPLKGATADDGIRALEIMLEARRQGGLSEDSSNNPSANGVHPATGQGA